MCLIIPVKINIQFRDCSLTRFGVKPIQEVFGNSSWEKETLCIRICSVMLVEINIYSNDIHLRTRPLSIRLASKTFQELLINGVGTHTCGKYFDGAFR